MNYLPKIIFGSFFLLPFLLLAQTDSDTSKLLDEVLISSNRLKNFSTGTKLVEIDSVTLALNQTSTLAELLSTNSQVFIKSYSTSGLATPSFRGSGAGHTAILWNGFNISSSMNGLLDFSLVPANFSNSIKLQFGGSSSLWGTGAIGGTVHLENQAHFNKGYQALISNKIGSFAAVQTNVKVEISKKRVVSVTSIFLNTAKNNFSYQNTTKKGKPYEKLVNSETNQKGFLQENYFKPNQYQLLSTRIWTQWNDRNIPASMTAAQSEAKQLDNVVRITAEWKKSKNQKETSIRSAYFNETLQFIDPQIRLDVLSRTQTWINELESKLKVGKSHLFSAGINSTYNVANAENYSFSPTQHRLSFMGSYKVKLSRFQASTSIRKEYISTGGNPITGSLGVEFWINRALKIRSSTSQNYRIPTFNDLYWATGGSTGNPDLKPENGTSMDGGVSFYHCVNKTSLSLDLSVFSSKLNDWIAWAPTNDGKWKPFNLAKVWSRGIEVDFNYTHDFNKVRFYIKPSVHYILSTNESTNEKDKDIYKKQLLYTPVIKGGLNTGLTYKEFNLSYVGNFVGQRFTSTDNKDFLESYLLHTLILSKNLKINKLKFSLNAQVQNILNTRYQIILNYPLPGRIYEIGISLLLHKNTFNSK